MKRLRNIFAPLLLVSGLCIHALPQNPTPIGIRPQSPEGKGIVALKAARLIDGTGAAPITSAVVIVTDNRITAVGSASSVRIPAGAKVIDYIGSFKKPFNSSNNPSFPDSANSRLNRFIARSITPSAQRWS